MSQILVRRQHRLDSAAARRLVTSVAGDLQRQYGGTFTWEGDTLAFNRPGASGHVAIRDGTVEVLVELGLLLRALRGRIEREIRTLLDGRLDAPPAQEARPATRPSASARSSRSQGASRSVRPK